MPISSKYSIDKLIEACKIYTETLNRRIIFEYSLISGVNDANEQAIELAKITKNILCHMNLIPVNEIEGLDYKKSNKNQYRPGFFGSGILSFDKNINSKKNPHNEGRYFLGIPAPVGAPGIVRPDGAGHDPDGQKYEAQNDALVDQIVQNGGGGDEGNEPGRDRIF